VRPAVLVVAALLLGVPSTMLGARWSAEGSWPVSEYPASFQVYSASPRPEYDGIDASGRSRPLSLDGLPRVVRAVGTGRVVPDLLCARHPELTAVRRTGGVRPGTFPC
jgi:hypothetical protein